jgi:hypothetical protein
MLQTVVTKGNVALDAIDSFCDFTHGFVVGTVIVNSDVSDSELFEVQLSVLLVAHIRLTR